jgi:hypothetical protein
LESHNQEILHSGSTADLSIVGRLERAVQTDPTKAFVFDATGAATLQVGRQSWNAGRFSLSSVAELRAKAVLRRSASVAKDARLRLFVIDGGSAITDIGSLQACAGEGSLFQVASQFNCLESCGSSVVPIEEYLSDSTQGPRASVSALPGTLLRHYAAPNKDGTRFTQLNNGAQLNLLADVCDAGVARVHNGYLQNSNVPNPRAFLAALETRFNSICVGVHDDVQVVLGYNWSGAVPMSPAPRIGQVFTSTMAGGGYGKVTGEFEAICRQLLRAAYLGTLLAAVGSGRTRVVLTLIGGGVFANPMGLIWDAITWACDEVLPYLDQDLKVVVNGRSMDSSIPHATLLSELRKRDGLLLLWPQGQTPRIIR